MSKIGAPRDLEILKLLNGSEQPVLEGADILARAGISSCIKILCCAISFCPLIYVTAVSSGANVSNRESFLSLPK